MFELMFDSAAEINNYNILVAETWREYLSGNIWDYWLGSSWVFWGKTLQKREGKETEEQTWTEKSQGPNVGDVELTRPGFKLKCSSKGSRNWIHSGGFHNFSQ